jgi:hypothetical protein
MSPTAYSARKSTYVFNPLLSINLTHLKREVHLSNDDISDSGNIQTFNAMSVVCLSVEFSEDVFKSVCFSERQQCLLSKTVVTYLYAPSFQGL